jgi:hypothetical protein
MSDDRYDPGMPGDGRAADRSLVACRSNNHNPPADGMIEGLFKGTFTLRGWSLECQAQIDDARASIDEFYDGFSELLGCSVWQKFAFGNRLREDRSDE